VVSFSFSQGCPDLLADIAEGYGVSAIFQFQFSEHVAKIRACAFLRLFIRGRAVLRGDRNSLFFLYGIFHPSEIHFFEPILVAHQNAG
jgi:hypothetical protein